MLIPFFATWNNLSRTWVQFIRDEFLILSEMEENIFTLPGTTAAKLLRMAYLHTQSPSDWSLAGGMFEEGALFLGITLTSLSLKLPKEGGLTAPAVEKASLA